MKYFRIDNLLMNTEVTTLIVEAQNKEEAFAVMDDYWDGYDVAFSIEECDRRGDILDG